MSRFVALLACGLLTACATGGAGVRVTNVDLSTLYSQMLMQWLGAGRDVRVVVVGNPTSAPTAAWEKTVTDRLNHANWFSYVHFTTTPDGSQRDNFRLVVVFDAPITTSGAAACAGDVDKAKLAPNGDQSIIVMALCNEKLRVTTARAWTAAITSPDAPQLGPALGDLMRAALPRRNPETSPNRGINWVL